VLLRRTRLGLLAARELFRERDAGTRPGDGADPAGGGGAVRRTAAVLAKELGWSAEQEAGELDAFAQEARAEGLLGA